MGPIFLARGIIQSFRMAMLRLSIPSPLGSLTLSGTCPYLRMPRYANCLPPPPPNIHFVLHISLLIALDPNNSLSGSATHGGGSCQFSLSYDGGSTWAVIHSIIGGCPLNSAYTFSVPNNIPSGNALFAWTWFNKVGNR